LRGIMVPTEGSRERAEEMREVSKFLKVKNLW
jgi:hypothetical protein